MGKLNFRNDCGTRYAHDELGRIKYHSKYRSLFDSKNYDFYWGNSEQFLGSIRRVDKFGEESKYEMYVNGVYNGAVTRTYCNGIELFMTLLDSNWRLVQNVDGYYCVIYEGERLVATVIKKSHWDGYEYFLNVSKFADEVTVLMIVNAMANIVSSARVAGQIVLHNPGIML